MLASIMPLFLSFSVTAFSQPKQQSLSYNLQVGAWGDSNSIGNMGVRAEIRTHLYLVNSSDQDSFWIGDRLANGGFIQFGYTINARGNYCDYAEMGIGTGLDCTSGFETLNGSEALWFWAYFPDVTQSRFYYSVGRSGSLEVNGTWHSYGLAPGPSGGVEFLLDGNEVSMMNLSLTKSSDRAAFVAEKTTKSMSPGSLGPVEFQNLAYLKEDSWHQVTALTAIVTCGVTTSCLSIPYGVTLVGPNHIIAGTSVVQPNNGMQLWPNESSAPSKDTLWVISQTQLDLILVIVGVLAIVAVFCLRKPFKRTGDRTSES